MPHARLRGLRAATLTAALLALPITPAAGQARPAGPISPAPAGGASSAARPAQVLLITGDRLLALPGAPAAIIAGHHPVAFLSAVSCSQSLKIPEDALPYVGRGLDPSLFELAALEHAERGGRLPVQLSYHGIVPAVPGVTILRSGGGTAAGYLTAASARAFGAALRRQFAADRGRGSYGTDGLFAHGLSIALAGTHAPARATPQFPMGTLTVTGKNLAGKPDTGDTVLVFNLDNCNKLDLGSSTNTFYHGTAKFSVPQGHYWAAALFTGATARLMILPQFTVGRATTVHFSGQAPSSKITVKTPRPAQLASTAFSLLRSNNGFTEGVQWLNSVNPSPPINSPALSVGLVRHRPSIGGLHAYTQAQLFSPPGPGIPYVYQLDLPAPSGTIPVLHYTARPAGLATVHGRYYKDVKTSVLPGGLGGWATVGGSPREIAAGLGGSGFVSFTHMPGRQIQYLSAAPPALWQTIYAPYLVISSLVGPLRRYHPGEQVTENWNRYPLHPTPNSSLTGAGFSPVLPSASRAGNALTLDITPFGDNQPGAVGSGYASCFDFGYSCHGRYMLYQNGVKILSGDAAAVGPGFPGVLLHAQISTRPSLIKFVLTASRATSRTSKFYLLSATSKDVWTWRSQPEPGTTVPAPWRCTPGTSQGSPADNRRCAVQDMTTLRYQVAGLSLTGTTKPGRQQVAITASQIQLAPPVSLTHASVRVSFDGGKTWHPATVSKLSPGHFRAKFTAPAGAKVTLRTRVSGTAGTSVTETIWDAYRVANRGHR
jgi:hypothetical protein